ncbi:hypothetical protein [Singulisphaera sp. GP187]|uniref:hypothetical protein n=1 Tax=Singulisphaera sp. GP187 TaxID=1882752 RepID=UPI0013565857|nr:hypothetical protein [Singulisphaera sp. GP187]
METDRSGRNVLISVGTTFPEPVIVVADSLAVPHGVVEFGQWDIAGDMKPSGDCMQS